jgi:hypothetical protein
MRLSTIFCTIAIVLLCLLSVGAVIAHAESLKSKTQQSAEPTTLPSPNAYDYFVAAEKLVADHDFEVFSYKNNADEIDRKRRSVAKNALALNELRDGFRYPYHHSPPGSFTNSELSQLAGFRQLARLLVADSQVKCADGDWNGAAESDLDAVELGQVIVRGEAITGFLVGTAVQAIGRSSLWKILPHLTESQCRQVRERLSKIQHEHVPYWEILSEEETYYQSAMKEALQSPDWKQEIVIGWSDPSDRTPITLKDIPGKETILLDYTKYMDQLIVNVQRSYPGKPDLPALPKDRVAQFMISPATTIRSALFFDLRNETANSLLLTTNALREYKLKHDSYPVSLQALAPDFLISSPRDLFAATPSTFRYKRNGDGYLLYSVGPDGKDDHGKAIDKAVPKDFKGTNREGYSHSVREDSVGDIVAGVNI